MPTKPQERRWKRVVLIFLVIGCLLTAVAIVLNDVQSGFESVGPNLKGPTNHEAPTSQGEYPHTSHTYDGGCWVVYHSKRGDVITERNSISAPAGFCRRVIQQNMI